MKTDWPIVRLGDYIFQTENPISVSTEKKYKLLGMSLEGRGLFLREEKSGMEIGAKTLNKLSSNSFIYSRLFAWKGAFDVVKEEFQDMFVSDEYPTFSVDPNTIDVRFLGYYFHQSSVWQKVESFCIGVTKGSRNRFKEKYLLDFPIPLPPLAEQQRIVAKLDAVKARLAEVEQLRTQQDRDIRALLNNMYDELFVKAPLVPVSEVLSAKRIAVKIDPEQTYQQVTVRMDHKGVTLRQSVKGSEVLSAQLLANKNDFVISKIDARNGAMGLVPAELDGAIVTNDFPLYSLSDQLRPAFFSFITNTRQFNEACKNASEGTTNRKRLKTSRFESILIPCPTLKEQDLYLHTITGLKNLQSQHARSATLLSQLMPSLLAQAFGA